jgi:hypothetical protein
MNIRPIDDLNNLFAIKDAVSEELIHELSQLNLMDMPWEPQKTQEQKNRRCIIVEPHSVFERIEKHINSKKSILEEVLQMKIESIWPAFWLDLEGFSITRHIDNSKVDKVMQLYLTNNDSSPTIFFDVDESEIYEKDTLQKYYYKDGEGPIPKVRHQFDCIQNTGYMMINNKTQLHGNPDMCIGPDEQRLSMYCHIIENIWC